VLKTEGQNMAKHSSTLVISDYTAYELEKKRLDNTA
jgi:hypothetical protein